MRSFHPHAAALFLALSLPVAAAAQLPARVADDLRHEAGPYPFVDAIVQRGDSAILVFQDSSYTAAAINSQTWMFGPPTTKAEDDGCPPQKVLGRKVARVFWREVGKAAALKFVIVRVEGTTGKDRFSYIDLYYIPAQLEGRWVGDPEHP